MKKAIFVLLLLNIFVATNGAVNLTQTGVIIPTAMYRGINYPISVTVRNSGTTSTSTTFTVNISINTSSTYNGNQTYLGQLVFTGGLAAGATRTLSTTVTIPCTYSIGTRFILIGVNPSIPPRAVTESDYSDNDMSYSFLLQTAPDLVPLNYTLSTSSETAGNNLTANFAVNNNGGTSTGMFTVGFYLSNSTSLNINQATNLGSYSITSLSGCGQTISLNKNLNIPSSVCTGDYFLHMWIDNGRAISEVDDNNNFQYRPLNIEGIAPPASPVANFGDESNPSDFSASSSPELTWTSQADIFWINISRCPYGSSNIIYSADCVSDNSYTVPNGELETGRLYRWNMYASNFCCEDDRSSVSNTRYFNIPPVISSIGSTTICTGSTTLLQTAFYSGATYQWYLNGTAISGANQNTFTVTLPGRYTVRNLFSCGSTSSSNSIDVTIQECCESPTIQASNILFTDIGSDHLTVNWDNGNGDKRIVRVSTLPDFTNVEDGTDPIGNSTYQGTLNQVVYNGTNNSVDVSGLESGNGYFFIITEGNCSGTSSVYLNTSTANNQAFIFLPESLPPVAEFSSLNSTLIAGQTASFFDQSSNNPTSWQWTVEREQFNGFSTIIHTSSQQNPEFHFSTPACYRITLRVENAAGSNEISRPCYVYVSPNLTATIPPDVTRSQKYYSYHGGDPVNLVDGSFSFQMKDISISALKSSLVLDRKYFSNLDEEGVFGVGWSHSFDIKIDYSNPFDWIVRYPDGHSEHFVPYKNGETKHLYPGNFDSLVYTLSGLIPASFTLITKGGIRWNFNGEGRIMSIEDLYGNETTFSYIEEFLVRVTGPGGRSLQFSYNPFRKIESVTDDINRTVYYYYDSMGHYLDSTRIGNSITSFKYDSYGMTEIYDPNGNEIVYNKYDTYGRVYEQYDADEKLTKFQYNTPNTAHTTIINPLQKSRVIIHDNKSRCIKVINEVNDSTLYGYSENNTLDSIIDARNFLSIINHDNRGNIIKVIDAKGFSDSIAYAQFNRPSYFRDKEGNSYRWEYDAKGSPTHFILPTSDTVEIEYNIYGQDSIITDARGFKTVKQYNGYGDLIQIITPTSSTAFSYDAVGRLLTIENSYGRRDSFYWNYFDQLVRHVDKMGYIEEYAYDPNGNEIFYKDKEDRVTITEFTSFDKPKKIIQPLNHISEFVYDDNQQVVKARDANLNAFIYWRDDVGRITMITDSVMGTLHKYEYDKVGNVVQYIDGQDKAWISRFDALNRVTSILNPLGDSIQYEYNNNSQLIANTNEEGRITRWEYDVIGRHNRTVDALNNFVQLFYNRSGQIDSIRDARGNIRNKTIYDASGRVVSINDGFGNYIINWDSSSLIKSISDPDGRMREYTYNLNNELTNIRNGQNMLRHFLLNRNGEYLHANSNTNTAIVIRNELGWVTSYTDTYSNTINHEYDSVGLITKMIYPGGKEVKYKYNSQYKCIEIEDWNDRLYTIGRDKNGGITSIVYPNNYKTEIKRDDTYRVQSWINTNDTNGIFQSNFIRLSKSGNVEKDSGLQVLPFLLRSNVLNSLYAIDDRIQSIESATLSSNNSGQRVRKIISGGSEEYRWSFMGELDSVFTNGNLQSAMGYDAFNERVSTETQQGQFYYIVDHYLAEFPTVLQERNASNEELINYLFIPEEGILLARDSMGVVSFYHHNVAGNVIALSNTSGEITDKYGYSLLADTFFHFGSSTQPITWMGMYGVQKFENELYYLHARYYDGRTNTFLSCDPNFVNYYNTQDINRYQYGYNNPLRYIDPTGMVAWNNISYRNISNVIFGNFESQKSRGEPAYSLDQFREANSGASYKEIIRQSGMQYGIIPKGPTMRYVVDPKTGNELDMRHVMVVGYSARNLVKYTSNPFLSSVVTIIAGNLLGLGIETGQYLSKKHRPSAFNKQDFYSNNVGSQFAAYQLLNIENRKSWADSFYDWISP